MFYRHNFKCFYSPKTSSNLARPPHKLAASSTEKPSITHAPGLGECGKKKIDVKEGGWNCPTPGSEPLSPSALDHTGFPALRIPGSSETMSLSIPALDAINALTPSQVDFLKALPKAELHAHLNGSIPLPVLQQLAKEYKPSEEDSGQILSAIKSGVERLQNGVVLKKINEFFDLFPAIYALTSTKGALARVTDAVLAEFLEPKNGEEYPQATYLELRSTPKKTVAMTRLDYVETVLDAVEKYRPDQAALIVSIDRRMSKEVANECVNAAITLKQRGRRVVGVDLCGDPNVSSYGSMATSRAYSLPAGRYGALWESLCSRQSRGAKHHTSHR